VVGANECTSVVGNFDGHGSAPMQYGVHRLMQHDQGFTGSHRTPPLGDYSLRITPAAARAIINTTIMQHVPTFLAVLMAITMQQYYTMCIARWRRFVTKRHHQAGTCSIIAQSDTPKLLFWTFHHEKGLQRQRHCFRHFIVKKSFS